MSARDSATSGFAQDAKRLDPKGAGAGAAGNRPPLPSLVSQTSQDVERLQAALEDARRYRRLQVLGCAPSSWEPSEPDTYLFFTNLDAFVDADRADRYRGEPVDDLDALASPTTDTPPTEREQIVAFIRKCADLHEAKPLAPGGDAAGRALLLDLLRTLAAVIKAGDHLTPSTGGRRVMGRMTEAEAIALAAKRERHKSKFLASKRWSARHDSVRGWHVALIDVDHSRARFPTPPTESADAQNPTEGKP